MRQSFTFQKQKSSIMKKFFLMLAISLLFVSTDLGSSGTLKSESEKVKPEVVEFYEWAKDKEFNSLEEYIQFLQCYHPDFIENRKIQDSIRAAKREIEIQKFLGELSKKESSCNWKVTNRFGYMGKYQIGKAVLKDFNLYPKINSRDFRRNPWIFPEELQDSIVVELMYNNKLYLKDYMETYRGHKIAGYVINDAAVLSAAHLVGKGNMRKFFESKGEIMPKDGNGVTAGDYMKHFGEYDFIL